MRPAKTKGGFVQSVGARQALCFVKSRLFRPDETGATVCSERWATVTKRVHLFFERPQRIARVNQRVQLRSVTVYGWAHSSL